MMTCGEYALFLRESAVRAEPELSMALTKIIEVGVDLARGYIGADQPGWDKLSGATLDGFLHRDAGFWIPGKIDLGFSPPDNPLLRTGQMRDSIEGEVDGLVGTVGSTERRALYQEMGTPGATYPIPPRPFLARAVEHLEPLAIVVLEEVAASLLVPGAV